MNSERYLPITLSNANITTDVPTRTIIGTLQTLDQSGNVIACSYSLTKGSIGYFAISDNELITAWTIPGTGGLYSVRVRAVGSTVRFSGSATFTINIVPPPPPPPPSSAMPTLVFSRDTLTVGYSGPSGTNLFAFGTTFRSSGKVGFTAKLATMAHPGNASIGFANASATGSVSASLGEDANSFGIHGTGIYSIANTYGNPTGVTFGSGSIVDVALDLTNKSSGSEQIVAIGTDRLVLIPHLAWAA